MKFGVSILRDYIAPGCPTPGLEYLISTNLTTEQVDTFVQAARQGLRDEYERLEKPNPRPPILKVWLRVTRPARADNPAKS